MPHTSPEHTAVLEIAVYTVHTAAAESFPSIQLAVHQLIASMPGFRASSRLRGLDDAAVFADVIEWDSLEAAESAAAKVPSLQGAEGFLSAINVMRVFTHVPLPGMPPQP
jgi:hypothetical protein